MAENNYLICDENLWIKKNSPAFSWYYKEYPFLQSFNLPLPFSFLQEFYKNDYNDRNLEINQDSYNCYDFVFSYFLANYTKPLSSKFQGKTWLGYLWENFPNAFKKTFEDANDLIFNPLGNFAIKTLMITLGIAIIVFLILKKIR